MNFGKILIAATALLAVVGKIQPGERGAGGANDSQCLLRSDARILRGL